MKTNVIFLYDKNSKDVFAWLYDSGQCYAHVGQHSTCTAGYAKECKEATTEDYLPLKRELESLGYDLEIKPKFKRTIDYIILPVNCKYGAPMGRRNIGNLPITVTSGPRKRIFKKHQTKVYDRYIPMSGGYDRGGAYWGLPDNIRVKYTKDLEYIEFYRPDK